MVAHSGRSYDALTIDLYCVLLVLWGLGTVTFGKPVDKPTIV